MFNVCIGLNSELMFDDVCVYIHINRYSTFSNVSLLLNLIWATRTELTFENLSTEETMQVFLSSLFKLAHMDKPQKRPIIDTLQHTATHCNTLQHTATHCNTLQHTAIHCNTLHMGKPHKRLILQEKTLCVRDLAQIWAVQI